MNTSVMNLSTSKSVTLNPVSNDSRLLLYEQYGAVAYGVILQIIPQPQQAQEVLVELFASPELQAKLSASANTTCLIVRLARLKALHHRQQQQLPVSVLPEPAKQSELIFNLLFYQNQTPDAVADRLQIQRSAVFGAVREFFAHILPS
ncbi:hypothetical protein [Fibrella forsythiae]|uniref:Sigma-70 family RNA polymerase sigma factor n=1 Tax=Fibrella forsythiae TaxID=2817061 RepID=A0ABS3JR21_9BACT|nr:hypothetical protein [Fibrella forsythiae]MBO0952451.1 hypothetical protein [Fibrella forsythiae]